jgi:hypothetical protein
MSFANRIEKGRFIPELKRGDFSHPDLNVREFAKLGVHYSHNSFFVFLHSALSRDYFCSFLII